jgi:predicted RNA polymerase sigma factor
MAAFACTAPAGFLRAQRTPSCGACRAVGAWLPTLTRGVAASRKPQAQRVVRARAQASAAEVSPELPMPCRRQVRFACASDAARCADT